MEHLRAKCLSLSGCKEHEEEISTDNKKILRTRPRFVSAISKPRKFRVGCNPPRHSLALSLILRGRLCLALSCKERDRSRETQPLNWLSIMKGGGGRDTTLEPDKTTGGRARRRCILNCLAWVPARGCHLRITENGAGKRPPKPGERKGPWSWIPLTQIRLYIYLGRCPRSPHPSIPFTRSSTSSFSSFSLSFHLWQSHTLIFAPSASL